MASGFFPFFFVAVVAFLLFHQFLTLYVCGIQNYINLPLAIHHLVHTYTVDLKRATKWCKNFTGNARFDDGGGGGSNEAKKKINFAQFYFNFHFFPHGFYTLLLTIYWNCQHDSWLYYPQRWVFWFVFSLRVFYIERMLPSARPITVSCMNQ